MITFEYIFTKLLPILISGFGVTLSIFFLTLLFSIPLGMVIATWRMSKHKIIQAIVGAYILIMRGTPLMLQIVCVFYAPSMIAGLTYDRFTAVIIAFSLNYAAYFAEIFRGGILAIPVGQSEAAATLGMTKNQSFFRIILPQVAKNIIPASSNEIITLVKDTSLAKVIAVTEMFSAANRQMSNKVSIIPLFVAGAFYLIFNWILTIVFSKIEKKMNYYK